MKFEITEIINILLALFSAVLTGVIIPIAKEKLSQTKREKLEFWIKIAVKAAEQIYGSKRGLEKKEYVVSFLLSKGIVFDVDEVTAMIESTVYNLTNQNAIPVTD